MIRSFYILLIMLFSIRISAQELSVDVHNPTLNKPFEVTVTASNIKGSIDIVSLDGLQILQKSKSISVSIADGKTDRKIEHKYLVLADEIKVYNLEIGVIINEVLDKTVKKKILIEPLNEGSSSTPVNNKKSPAEPTKKKISKPRKMKRV